MAYTRRTKTAIFITTTTALAIAFVALMSVFGSSLVRMWLYGEVDAKQRVLLYQTDHDAVLAALRAAWETGTRNADFSVDDPSFPDVLRKLQPHAVTLDGPTIRLEFGGAEYHYGFEAAFAPVPKADEEMMFRSWMDSRKLRENLWFYADKGLVEP